MITFGDESQSFTPISGIPSRFDANITLISPLDDTGIELVDLTNRNISFVPLNAIGSTVEVQSNENGEVYVELAPGFYQVKDSSAEDYVLFTTLEIIDSDIAEEAIYAKSVTVTGTIYGYKNAFDENWNENEILDNRTLHLI